MQVMSHIDKQAWEAACQLLAPNAADAADDPELCTVARMRSLYPELDLKAQQEKMLGQVTRHVLAGGFAGADGSPIADEEPGTQIRKAAGALWRYVVEHVWPHVLFTEVLR